MRLSELKALVAEMEENIMNPENPDPDVRFWMPRPKGLPAGPKQTSSFIEFTISLTPDSAELMNHMVNGITLGCIPQLGDFSIPVTMVDFYK